MTARRRGIALAALLLALFAAAPAGAAAASWQPIDPAAVRSQKLFDAGVTDWNGDGALDLFTTNHKFPSSLLSGDGAGGLTESVAGAGLSPTPAFPGFEDLFRAPDTSAPGIYVYASTRSEPGEPLRIRTTGASASGTLTFAARTLSVERSDGATVATGTAPDGRPTLSFEAGPGAAIDVVADHLDLPIEVAVDPPADPGSIRIGADAVAATDREFELNLRDRHGFGFADFDGDGTRDLFVSSGGLGGEIADPWFTGRQRDELLLRGPGGYADRTAGSGLVKGSCRGRSVVVADFDGDGDLDALQGCEASGPLIHLGDGSGGFTTTPGPPAPATTYRAIDLVGDRRPEIVAAGAGTVSVWRGGPGAWRLAQELRLPGEPQVAHLAQGDYDDDGDLDLFAAALEGNWLLRNADGRLRRRDPGLIGLPPGGSATAAFADYDNDGDLDLDLVPQGLMDFNGTKYRRTGKLAYPPLPDGRIRSASASWPDLNGDGRRDPLITRGRGEFAASQIVDARLSTPPANLRGSHWLEVDLTGPAGNHEAIGASVRAITKRGRSTRWVGESEDSRASSGHYRLYWGLGRVEMVKRLLVLWPDGTRTVRRDVPADRLLSIAR
ncbi:MAG: CRTAC1 family protein [Solirubrobacterales bacterium]